MFDPFATLYINHLFLLLLAMQKFRRLDKEVCVGLNENGLHGLKYLNTGFPADELLGKD